MDFVNVIFFPLDMVMLYHLGLPQTHCITQDSCRLKAILLPQPPKCWNLGVHHHTSPNFDFSTQSNQSALKAEVEVPVLRRARATEPLDLASGRIFGALWEKLPGQTEHRFTGQDLDQVDNCLQHPGGRKAISRTSEATKSEGADPLSKKQ